MRRPILFLLLILAFSSVNADGVLLSWNHNDLQGMTKARWDLSMDWTKEQILDKIKNADEWPECFLLMGASLRFNKDKEFLRKVAELLINPTATKLKNTGRLIIWERITSDDILFEGKGYVVDDDLFSVAGRANYILRNITSKNFGFVSVKSSASDLEKIRQSWSDYLSGLKVQQYQDPCISDSVKGIKQIQSRVALEALVHSLLDSKEKELATTTCLKKTYNLEKMPKDKSSSAQYCNPDQRTIAYLGMLTGQKNNPKITNKYWINWWKKNKGKLVWSKEEGIFRVEAGKVLN